MVRDTVTGQLQRRRATRAISPQKLNDQIVQDLIEAVRLTPSCMNNQPWRYVFVESDKMRERVADFFTGGNRAWAPQAALIVFGYSRVEDDCTTGDGRIYHQFDLGMSAMNLMLAATEHGLVARPMAGFSPEKVRELFSLTEKDQPFIAIAIGFPAETEEHVPEKFRGFEEKPRIRKEATEIIDRV